MIQFKNITKTYKEDEVLKNLSFSIAKGSLVAIIGGSGSGKTTTLKMINRLIKPTSGQICIDGEDIADMDIIALRRNMGYVIQQAGLFPHMTIGQNIELIPGLEERADAQIKERTLELMEMVGLDPEVYLDRYPQDLSGGQQQRIGIARAFANDPEIILMDEPFSALDPITRTSLQDQLVALQEKMKKTIVFVTHDMSEAIKIADKICILHEGSLLQYDTAEEILKRPVNDFVASFVGRHRIWESPEYIKAADIMLEEPVNVSPGTSLIRCIEKMREARVDTLLVVDRQTKKLLGMLRAESIRTLADKKQSVDNIMSPVEHCVSPQNNIVDVLKLINAQQVSSLPVVDEEYRLVGIITKSSLVTTLSEPYVETEVR